MKSLESAIIDRWVRSARERVIGKPSGDPAYRQMGRMLAAFWLIADIIEGKDSLYHRMPEQRKRVNDCLDSMRQTPEVERIREAVAERLGEPKPEPTEQSLDFGGVA